MVQLFSLQEYLSAHPEVDRVEAFVSDVNGVGRGKWLPRQRALAISSKGLAMPRSIFALDIWGRDVREAGLAYGTGDPDGLCWPIAGSVAPVVWADRPTAQVMLTMRDGDGAPFYADPRAMLGRMVERLNAKGLFPMVATELEFYLLDDMAARPSSRDSGQVLSIDALRSVAPVLDAIEDACRAQGVPAETIQREYGAGQYEINLRHIGDACLAADHAILLKRIVRGTAVRHGRIATFMAKPFGAQAGSGMHVHVSLLDRAGKTLFADEAGGESAMLGHAVGGLLSTMADAMLLFAPHANSYRRFSRGAYGPVTASWGYDDRSAAVRVITGSPSETRIEHRLAGADCNPYLALTAIFAGMLAGIDGAIDPGPRHAPSSHGHGERSLPLDWSPAIAAFAASDAMADALGTAGRDMVAACKRQDRDELLTRVPDTEYDTYLATL
ncbi:glutamine synthetase family protein [Sphingomonas sp.]|uniref:glutamine synthetase family protein n=1 Tax=Sphingomonas sp. TaxID=28214 RepID=UPI003B00C8F4